VPRNNWQDAVSAILEMTGPATAKQRQLAAVAGRLPDTNFRQGAREASRYPLWPQAERTSPAAQRSFCARSASSAPSWRAASITV
jgi:hypothetical protein